MRYFTGLLLLFLAAALNAQEQKLLPPGLSKQEAAAGWIALFDGESTYGWKAEGPAKVDDGKLVFGGNTTASLETNASFGAFELMMSYRLEGNNGGFRLRYGNSEIKKEEKNSNPDKTFHTFECKVPGVEKSAPLRLTTLEGTILFIESIRVKPLGGKSIFNGKDLTGWKVLPGHKSKFSVTDQGELHIQDGNGDIQTEAQWQDFVAQVDLISNGDHLNSGVFFRSVPGSFWAGYEAQIRNEWQSTVTLKNGESFTGSLTRKGDKLELKVGRETKKFTDSDVASIVDHRDKPIDFGTGGIYHHCPARRVVSTDREWFTMTIIAHGNHLAVWVNGFQTAEFTDNRPMNTNARNGRMDGAGCLSLQGHDPTTDLKFKNIRVAELPK
jgi:hypothetical protein